jgi:tetratricopeptide (TPR) repeat protein
MPSAQFVKSVIANIDYWTQRTGQLDERQFGVLDVDWPNLYRAVEFGLALPEARNVTIALSLQLYDVIEQRGHWREWIPVLEQVLHSCTTGERTLRYQLLDQLGRLYGLGWQLPPALESHRTAEAVALKLADERAIAFARYNLSEDYRRVRQYELAEHYGALALEGFERLGMTGRPVASMLNSLGMVAQARGQLGLSEERLRRAVALFRALDRPTHLARALNNLANTLHAAAKDDEALQCFAEAAQVLAPTASEFDKVMVELSRGTVYFDLGRLAEAEAAFRLADSTFLSESAHSFHRAHLANNLGNVLLAQGRLQEAEAQLRRSAMLWRETTDPLMLANTLGTLGETLVAQARPKEAVPLYDEALALLAGHPEDAWGCRLLAKFTDQRRQLGQI